MSAYRHLPKLRYCRSMSQAVGWDRGADRASNDADVSSIPPKIPYGGFSPVRLQGWHIRRDLPGTSFSLSLLPAYTARRPVCLRPSCFSVDPPKVGSVDAMYCTAMRWNSPPTPGALAPDRVMLSRSIIT